MNPSNSGFFFSDPLREVPLPPPGATVAVALSGGVDSSLAAVLMAERGCRIIGVTMSLHDPELVFPEGGGSGCYGPLKKENEETCHRLCAGLGGEYHVIDLWVPYKEAVMDYYRNEYLRGKTPNPCLRCNPLIKFGLLPEALRDMGKKFDFFVTGHYARLLSPGGEPERGIYLAPGKDASKDQSYFLHRLGGEQLRMARFPLGSMTKSEVRKLAAERGLASAEKKDSQDFIAKEDFDIVFSKTPVPQGDMVHSGGRILGKHRGLNRYTIGQRRGVGVSIGPDPLYVVSLDAENNRVVLGPEKELFSASLEASDTVWAPGFGTEPFRAFIKIRLAAAPALGLVTPREGNRVSVEFDTPQRAVAPGQSAVFYVPLSGETAGPIAGRDLGFCCIAGGGIIE
ncbi:tRNA 2-thiouridine(34) synthase MnmA [Breznakiella homolactica]|uniref:tRNA-specific 2-thiouridylase MnmA n=1 Tax=Breznakiella homolactica TaxID=2798577 RepID=A0A7T7XRR2_9SPIR|nr:tRNA 2-thiouridine(34) synthase MnmA [Breznakiella homolactica]QQO11258.1 tRNA 2-thiouridine(34) synthase MnmA [Breznakiella homolactica]